MALPPRLGVRFSPDIMELMRYMREASVRLRKHAEDPRVGALMSEINAAIKENIDLIDSELVRFEIIIAPSDGLLELAAKMRALEQALGNQ